MNYELNNESEMGIGQQPSPAPEGQLELGLGSARCRAARRPSRRSHRARWWFERMRQVVDRAMDYPPAPLPPEQMVFGVRNQAKGNSEERQFCE